MKIEFKNNLYQFYYTDSNSKSLEKETDTGEHKWVYFRMTDDNKGEISLLKKKNQPFDGSYIEISLKTFRFKETGANYYKFKVGSETVINQVGKFFYIGSDDTRFTKVGANTRDHWFVQKLKIGTVDFHPFIGIAANYASGFLYVKYFSKV